MNTKILGKLSDEKVLADCLFDSMLIQNDLGVVEDMEKDKNGQRWVRVEGDFNLDAIAHDLAVYLQRTYRNIDFVTNEIEKLAVQLSAIKE